MRLSDQQRQAIRQQVSSLFGPEARVKVFGSRADDQARGGDLDLLVICSTPLDQPAMLAARLAASVERILEGRKVDVLLDAPDLKHLPIHRIAHRDGVPL